MNVLDPYDITNQSSTPPPQEPGTEPTLNEELTQVVGQLGRFWGGFRKQSQAAFESAKHDFSQVVTQAQKELGKLTSETPATGQATVEGSSTTEHSREVKAEPSGSEDNSLTSSSTSETLQPTPTPSSPVQTLFTRIQQSLPPAISNTLQTNLPDALRTATGSVTSTVDFAQLKSTLSTEFQRVQGVTRAQAEEYVHKSEVLLKEAGEFLKDAVKVVPPEEQDSLRADGADGNVVWDGSDVWVMPSPVGTVGWGGNKSSMSGGKGKGKEEDARQRGLATRADAMLHRLKRDPDMIKLDPLEDDNVKALFETWRADEVQSKDGGIDGAAWSERINAALDVKDDGDALRATRDDLVPSTIDNQTFWTRYFFRIYQIEQEEVKRKTLLAVGAADNDEDFSWEDEDDNDNDATPDASLNPSKTLPPPSPSPADHNNKPVPSTAGMLSTSQSHTGAGTAEHSAPSSQAVTPATTSPRESSEGSYDVVSSGNVSSSPETISRAEKEGDDDSDWE
ncbi:hypothetical protein BD410DRAFT_859806 [Rickenella mellea]|uniref:BSD domain-containing protein n=1 Tax=Rickenella mellea TaxID=50990 RepID=A0A4Y7PI18_9AGAM|nr:hypothetical protein BD410DRAFT_859806 [Rickenella mellea]